MTRGPRILVAGAVLGQPASGVRRHNAELLPRIGRALHARGGELCILEGSTPIVFDLPREVRRLRSNVPYLPTYARALREGRTLRRALRGARAAGRPFDLVHTGHLPLPRGLGVPMTWTVHDLRSLDRGRGVRGTFARRFLRSAARRAVRVGVVSESMEERMLREFPELEGRVDRIGNGADHLPRMPRAPGAEPFLLHVGHLEERKNLGLLVRALALDPTLPRVVLAGDAKGGAEATLRTAAEAAGVEGRVHFEGPVDDSRLAALYAEATCAVFPSWLEGFGIGVAEARRAGCPTAASDIPAHRELDPGGVALFDPRDPSALVAAVRRAAALPAPGALPTWGDCADRWIRLFERALESPNDANSRPGRAWDESAPHGGNHYI